jgi:membrane protein
MADVQHPARSPNWGNIAITAGAIAAAWAVASAWVLREIDRPVAFAPAHFATVARPAIAAPTAAALSPYRMPWRLWRQVLAEVYEGLNEDRLLAVAAGVVFYGLLAIFPSIAALVSLYGLFAESTTMANSLSLLSGILPSGGIDIVRSQIERIASADGSLSLAFVGGLALALWSSNAGMKAMIDALNVIEEVKERRGFVLLNLVSMALTLGAIVVLLLAIGAVVALPIALSTLGLKAGALMPFVRWPALLVIVLAGLATLYRFGPNGARRRWRFASPGTLAAALAWLASSAALSFYLSNFADYNATYGSLGAGIGLMMWMWLSAVVVLLGAQIDRGIDAARRNSDC